MNKLVLTRLREDARETFITVESLLSLRLRMTGDDVSHFLYLFQNLDLFLRLPLIEAFVKEVGNKVIRVLMSPLQEGSEDCSFCKFIAE